MADKTDDSTEHTPERKVILNALEADVGIGAMATAARKALAVEAERQWSTFALEVKKWEEKRKKGEDPGEFPESPALARHEKGDYSYPETAKLKEAVLDIADRLEARSLLALREALPDYLRWYGEWIAHRRRTLERRFEELAEKKKWRPSDVRRQVDAVMESESGTLNVCYQAAWRVTAALEEAGLVEPVEDIHGLAVAANDRWVHGTSATQDEENMHTNEAKRLVNLLAEELELQGAITADTKDKIKLAGENARKNPRRKNATG